MAFVELTSEQRELVLKNPYHGTNITKFHARSIFDFGYWSQRMLINPKNLSEMLIIKPHHVEWASLVQEKKRVNILCHRGGGKTTILGQGYPIYKACYTKGWHMITTSKTQDQSKEIIKNIQRIINARKELHWLIPKNNPNWATSQRIYTSTNCLIECLPFNDKLLGHHPDYILCDEASTYQDLKLFNTGLVPMCNRYRATLCLIGTPKSETDLMMRQISNKSYVTRFYPIIGTKECGVNPLWYGKPGEPIFPEVYPKKIIETEIREENPWSFDREYLLKVTSPEQRFFPKPLVLAAHDTSYDLSFVTQGTVYVGVDFALSKGRHADYTVITVIDVVKGTAIIKHIRRFKGRSMPVQLTNIEEIYDIYHPAKIIVDSSNVGAAFLSDLKAMGLPVVGSDFSRKTRMSMLYNLRKLFEKNCLIIPYGEKDPATQSKMDILVSEVLGMELIKRISDGVPFVTSNKAHDDCVMSLCLACKPLIKSFSGNFIGSVVAPLYVVDPKNSSNPRNQKLPERRERHIPWDMPTRNRILMEEDF